MLCEHSCDGGESSCGPRGDAKLAEVIEPYLAQIAQFADAGPFTLSIALADLCCFVSRSLFAGTGVASSDQLEESAGGGSGQSGYSITLSARTSSLSGTWIASAFAVTRLMTRSNLVGRMMGISAGFSPLRIRPA
jgi:hypothetical protein